MKRTAHFVALAKITVEHEEGAPTSVLKSADVRLEISKNQAKAEFFHPGDKMKETALKPLTQCLIQGLGVVYKMGVKNKWKDKEEFRKYIFDELTRTLDMDAEVIDSTMEY